MAYSDDNSCGNNTLSRERPHDYYRQNTQESKSFFPSTSETFYRGGLGALLGFGYGDYYQPRGYIERLVKTLRASTHRTNHGEFLWRSAWDQSWVIQASALDTLKRLYSKKDRRCYFIIDDTQTLKRAKKMAGVVKLNSVTINKAFKDGEDWKYTNSFNIEDLPKVALVATEAYKYIRLREYDSQ